MTVVSATLLSLLFFGTKDMATRNEKIFNKRSILSAVNRYLDKDVTKMSDDEIENIFANNIQQYVVNVNGEPVTEAQMLASKYKSGLAEDLEMKKEKKKPESDRFYPVFLFEQGDQKYYIVSIRGNGLWDEIWGNIAIAEDFNTVVGAAFDHTGETPGLGAEIKDNPSFGIQFRDKKLYNNQGEYRSITVIKTPVKDPDHEVSGISGATITGNGVSEMLFDGIKKYEPYFAKEKQL